MATISVAFWHNNNNGTLNFNGARDVSGGPADKWKYALLLYNKRQAIIFGNSGNSNGKFLLHLLIEFHAISHATTLRWWASESAGDGKLRFALQTKNVIQFINDAVRISVPNMQSTVHAEYAMRSPTYIFCGRNFIGRRAHGYRALCAIKCSKLIDYPIEPSLDPRF